MESRKMQFCVENQPLRLHTGLSVGAQLRQFGQCCYNLVSVARIMPLVYGHLPFGHHNGTNVCVSGGRGCISIFVWFGYTLIGFIFVLSLLCVSILDIRHGMNQIDRL